ncbi:hypothetical protein, partial [uncultured Parasutterella sp.]|uniref:hypothetical protein n=1 Tax=uncultured Parasutterella sp. TaxID=1263098 RepID=UPI0025B63CD9
MTLITNQGESRREKKTIPRLTEVRRKNKPQKQQSRPTGGFENKWWRPHGDSNPGTDRERVVS